MRSVLCITAAVLGLLLVDTPARAQGQQAGDKKAQKDQKGGGQEEVSRFTKYFKEHDKNNDGFLDRNEAPESVRKDFQRIDNNNDSKISWDELRQYSARIHGRARPVAVTYIWMLQAETDPATQQDLQKAYESLRKLDGDNDGKITKEEIKARRQEYLKQQIGELLKECDNDNNSKISRDEAEGSFLSPHFDRLDRNNDGSLTREELMQAATEQRSKTGDSSGKSSNNQ